VTRSWPGIQNHCELHDCKRTPLVYKEMHYYTKKSLTVEGNPSLP